jgi:hypothetical protein
MLDLETVIDELHASEINGSISWFYDGVWRVILSDPLGSTLRRPCVAYSKRRNGCT